MEQAKHCEVFVEREGSENSLSHFGIKGQKWGIRRFQNEDGTLTNEGKNQYIKESKRSGGNKGAVTGMAVGGVIAGGRIAKSYLRRVKTGKNAGKIVSSGKKFTPVKDGMALMGLLALGGFLGKKIGEKVGKKKGKEDVAEYSKQFITQDAGLEMKSNQKKNNK